VFGKRYCSTLVQQKMPEEKKVDGFQTSINVFRKFLKRLPDGSVDANEITSTNCYHAWLLARKGVPENPQKAFQRALSGHLTGIDGRVPFDEDEEKAILKIVRRKCRWECFQDSNIRFGESGFRSKGFHEKAITGEIFNEDQSKKRAKRAYEQVKRVRYSQNEATNNEPETDQQLLNVVASAEAKGMIPSELLKTNGTVLPFTFMSPHALLATLQAGVQRFIVNGTPWFRSLLAISRWVLISRGWFTSPSKADAERLMRRINEEHPDDYVLLLDFTAADWTKRIVLQNELAVQYFGAISREHGGFKGRRFLRDDTWTIVKRQVEVIASPGKRNEVVNQRLFLIPHNRVGYFANIQYCDPETNLVVEHGRFQSETPTEPNPHGDSPFAL
jgi:hypothetical protein